MSVNTAEQFARRVLDCKLLEWVDLELAFEKAGGREKATLQDLGQACFELELLTAWQISNIADGEKQGFFYGDWRVLCLIGAGDLGRTFRACNSEKDFRTIRVLRQRYSSSLEKRKEFIREAKSAMKVCPSITYEIGEANNRLYVVMEDVEY